MSTSQYHASLTRSQQKVHFELLNLRAIKPSCSHEDPSQSLIIITFPSLFRDSDTNIYPGWEHSYDCADLGPEVRGLHSVVTRGRVLVLVIVLGAGGGPREGVSQHPPASSLSSSLAPLDSNISLKHEQM